MSARGPREAVAGGEWLYGRNPVEEALAARRRVCTEIVLPPVSLGDDGQLARIRDEALSRRMTVRTADRKTLDKIARGGHHQGVAMKASPYPYVDFEELAAGGGEGQPPRTLVLLDHIEDPQNLGSILRTACAAGADGVVVPEDRACGVTPAAARASAGGAEHVRVARVVNLVRAMQALKKAGFWLTGLDASPQSRPYSEIDFTGDCALVVGAEGSGLSRLVRENCDFLAHIPMPGGFESLNAGVAAGVALFEILRQRSVDAKRNR